jgi:threonine synthase
MSHIDRSPWGDYVFPARPVGAADVPLRLRCLECAASAVHLTQTRCLSCGGTLQCVGSSALPVRDPLGQGVWQFASLLPAVAPPNRVSLGEGHTPLLAAAGLSDDLGVDLTIKDETRHPTGSFKDRILAISASAALESGALGLVCASTGNAGTATAAYAARAGLPSLIIAPAHAPSVKVAMAQAYGATWISVAGDYSAAYHLAEVVSDQLGYLNVTTTFASPYSVEGSKTVGFELCEHRGTRVPDWIAVPIGAGPLLVGIEAAYRQLVDIGLVERIPRMLAVQPTGCAPIVRALRHGDPHVTAWTEPSTLVSGLADPLTGYAREGDITMAAVRRSGGAGVTVEDARTLHYVRHLARQTGVFGEPSGAISVAGVAQARSEGIIAAGESIICCVTGSGLKDLAVLGAPIKVPVIEPDLNALSTLLASRAPADPDRGTQP